MLRYRNSLNISDLNRAERTILVEYRVQVTFFQIGKICNEPLLSNFSTEWKNLLTTFSEQHSFIRKYNNKPLSSYRPPNLPLLSSWLVTSSSRLLNLVTANACLVTLSLIVTIPFGDQTLALSTFDSKRVNIYPRCCGILDWIFIPSIESYGIFYNQVSFEEIKKCCYRCLKNVDDKLRIMKNTIAKHETALNSLKSVSQ